MLEKYGIKANDAILAEEKHMGIYEDLLQNRNAKLIAGGAAQNTARGAQVRSIAPSPLCAALLYATKIPLLIISQYILPPNSTVFIGCVGQDKYAQILRERNDAAGLRAEYLTSTTHPTGRCGVVITGQHRSMVTDLAAANEYKISHLQSPEIWKLVQQARVYYVGGYHLTVCVPAILALAEEAAKENKIFVMSLSAPFIPQFFKEQLMQTSKYWDYIIGNETEARSWAEGQGHETRDVKEIARLVAELPKENGKRKRVVVFTQGTEETVVAVQGEKGTKEFGIKAVGKEEIVDTNGAG